MPLIYCSKCERWLVAATYFSPIESDTNEYQVVLMGGDFKNTAHVKAVSNVSNLNFLQARNAMQEGAAVVVKGNAIVIQNAASIFVRRGRRLPH